jgi:hypothetical protein
MISGFSHKVDEIGPLLGYYAAYSGNSLPTFWDNLSVLSSSVKNMGRIGFPEISVRNSYYALRNIPEERRSHFLIYST